MPLRRMRIKLTSLGKPAWRLDKYLSKTNAVDLTEDYKRGTLLSSETRVKGGTFKTEELWKPKSTKTYETIKKHIDYFRLL